MANERKKTCDAKALFGIDDPPCSVCVHNACPYYQKAKRDWMDDETDFEDGED